MELDEKQKANQQKLERHKLWLKACENILFICPCCQGHCLNDTNPALKNFSQYSKCNFDYKLEHHPRSLFKKDIYWYRVQGVKKFFYQARIVGLNTSKNMHKVEVTSIFPESILLKLSRE